MFLNVPSISANGKFDPANNAVSASKIVSFHLGFNQHDEVDPAKASKSYSDISVLH